MKILMLVSSLEVGGAETHVADLSRSLSERGHQVFVASGGGKLAEELKKEGIKQIKLDLSSRSPIRLILSWIKLARLQKKYSFDILHAHSRIAALLAHSVSKRKRVPLVTTVHAKFKTGLILKRLSKWGSLSISVSEDLKQYLCEEYGVLSDNVFVIPNGIDTKRFTRRAKRDESEFRISFVSRMDKDCSKAAFWLCRIAPMLDKRISNLRITLCGGGDSYETLKKEAEATNKIIGRRCVELTGSAKDVREILEGSHLFVGVSRAALEAMSMELPVALCGNEGFLGELREDNFLRAMSENFCARGESQGSPRALFEAILKIYSLGQEGMRVRGKALGQAVRESNRLERVAEATEEIYRIARGRIPASRGEIVLCGFYGFGNMGDDSLLLEAIKKCRREYPNAKISAITLGGRRDVDRFGVRCVSRRSFFAMMREIKRADLFVFGGGTLLQENSSRRSLIYYIWLLRYAQKNGVRCELWGNGIGEPRSDKSAYRIAKALEECSYVGLRDSSSVELARKLCREFGCVFPQIAYEHDLAISQGRSTWARVEYLLRKYASVTDNPNGFAVVSVRGGSGKGFLKSLSCALFELKRQEIGLLFVPMFPREDMKATKKLAESFGGEVATSLSGRDIAGIMSEAQEVCGMRLHTLVFAFVAGARFVGFGEDPKLESFCRENGGRYYIESE